MSENTHRSARVESYNELRFNKAFRSSQSTNWTFQRLSSTWRGTNHTGLRLSTSSLAASSPFGAQNSIMSTSQGVNVSTVLKPLSFNLQWLFSYVEDSLCLGPAILCTIFRLHLRLLPPENTERECEGGACGK